MIRKIAGILALAFLLFANEAWAHTALKESAPAAGGEVTEPIQELTLIYSTKIEENSSFTVTGSDGNTEQIETVYLDQDTVTIAMAEPLANDTYKIAWDIIGADGHPIQDSIEFTVNVPVNEETEQETDRTEEATPESEVTDNENVEADDDSVIVPVVIGIVAIILAASLWFMFRRKK
ncbi:hypothetical protein CYL18_02090 [Pradoshia eiseniae]|uniref:CopC domain-containing protein n=1 Tax=Pradoshia eiseniae TaxID=2064768 RepID=A0A2S7N401_9BACI|nr:copper resistance protein CopC [Pradoshia eiseniae]PQD96705.1 hypothetical protein CYL18_02090 [Pradoshia eiseniae]